MIREIVKAVMLFAHLDLISQRRTATVTVDPETFCCKTCGKLISLAKETDVVVESNGCGQVYYHHDACLRPE
jgi:hypothetical protein